MLSCAGQSFPVFAGFTELHQLLRGGPAEPFFERVTAAAPVLSCDSRTKLSAVKHAAELQAVGDVDVDLDIGCHALTLRSALVIGAEGQVNLCYNPASLRELDQSIVLLEFIRRTITTPSQIKSSGSGTCESRTRSTAWSRMNRCA